MPKSLTALVPLLAALFVVCLVAPMSQAAKPCFAEVLYLDKPYGHTYEYKCGGLRLRAGQMVRVPVKRYGSLRIEITTAVIVRISQVRTYFGGPLRTVAAVK
jgi:hypothetical protein